MTSGIVANIRIWVLAGLALLVPASLFAQTGERAQVGLQCVSYGTGPMLDCLVDLKRKDGSSLDNAQVMLGALMPSMPMAHTIKPARAASTGKPGQYQGTLVLEMPGIWTVDVEVNGPLRDKVGQNLMVNACKVDTRCTAAPAKTGEKSPPDGHGKGHGKGHGGG